jgi:hypothetical protein
MFWKSSSIANTCTVMSDAQGLASGLHLPCIKIRVYSDEIVFFFFVCVFVFKVARVGQRPSPTSHKTAYWEQRLALGLLLRCKSDKMKQRLANGLHLRCVVCRV